SYSLLISLRFPYFFFQAEDGIRDRNVTGVQTCALPISGSMNLPMDKLIDHIEKIKTHQDKPVVLVCNAGTNATAAGRQLQEQGRSEERRVGKEGRSGWWEEEEIKKE